ncbi:MAG: type II methionyl aminopeptidase [Nanoarchaeota archaeon]|nr:type II methionyl aminopeptidase [Nanoarchaeota archaeon]
MEEDIIEKYKKAGEIAKKVVSFSKDIVKENAKAIDVAEKIENEIVKLGGKPAWPVNISINSIAAHWTPKQNDETVFKKGDVVKIDIGVHVDGYIADTAYTKEIGTNNWKDLIKASEEANKAALDLVKPGVPISEIGKVIEETIKKYGFTPIANLSGHGLNKYETHVPPTIPNFDNKSNLMLEEGMAIAIEPFSTNGVGKVIDAMDSEIFKLEEVKPVRSPVARKILQIIEKEYKTLPFGKRWISKRIGGLGLEIAFRELKRNGVLHNYSVLKEESNGIVSQHEHTILVLDTPIVTTL